MMKPTLDGIGLICQEIDTNDDCSIRFFEGKAYITSNGKDFKIEVSLLSR